MASEQLLPAAAAAAAAATAAVSVDLSEPARSTDEAGPMVLVPDVVGRARGSDADVGMEYSGALRGSWAWACGTSEHFLCERGLHQR